MPNTTRCPVHISGDGSNNNGSVQTCIHTHTNTTTQYFNIQKHIHMYTCTHTHTFKMCVKPEQFESKRQVSLGDNVFGRHLYLNIEYQNCYMFIIIKHDCL